MGGWPARSRTAGSTPPPPFRPRPHRDTRFDPAFRVGPARRRRAARSSLSPAGWFACDGRSRRTLPDRPARGRRTHHPGRSSSPPAWPKPGAWLVGLTLPRSPRPRRPPLGGRPPRRKAVADSRAAPAAREPWPPRRRSPRRLPQVLTRPRHAAVSKTGPDGMRVRIAAIWW